VWMSYCCCTIDLCEFVEKALYCTVLYCIGLFCIVLLDWMMMMDDG